VTADNLYWSVTTDDASTGWLVDFRSGSVGVGSPGFALNARPVRSAF